MPRIPITNFSRGEIGPQLYGRIDVPQYTAGAKEISNFIIQRYGGAAFRPGFRFVAPASKTKIHAYTPFTYSIEQAYVLALGDRKMRVLANGGVVTETNLKILSVTTGASTTLEIPFHAMDVGDGVYIDGVEGMTELNGRFAVVSAVPDANHITINVNSSSFNAFSSSDGDTRVGAPAPPATPEPPPPTPPPASSPPTTGGPGSVDTGGVGTYRPPVGRNGPYDVSYE